MAGLIPFGGPFGGQQQPFSQGGVGGQGIPFGTGGDLFTPGQQFSPQGGGVGIRNAQGYPPTGMTEPPWMRNLRGLFTGGQGGGMGGAPAQPLFGTASPWGQGPVPWMPGGNVGATGVGMLGPGLGGGQTKTPGGGIQTPSLKNLPPGAMAF